MKIKTLAVIGLLALAPVHSTELNAASNTTVRVARDSSGKVDYKNFYQNGSRVKYENWNNGKKTVVINYKSGKVTSKTYYTNGVKTKYEKWSAGKVVQRTTYKYGKVTNKTYYTNGVKTKYEKWSNGRVVQRVTYKYGKVTSKTYYTNGVKTKYEKWSNGKIIQRDVYKNGKFSWTRKYKNGIVTYYQNKNIEITYSSNGTKIKSLQTVNESFCGSDKGLLCQKETFYNKDGSVKSSEYVLYENHTSSFEYVNGELIEVAR